MIYDHVLRALRRECYGVKNLFTDEFVVEIACVMEKQSKEE